ncbi:hypothetical protein KAS79_01575 [Candidatus Parcubacteria bacterium]|nr:hypothetical protein [Candidatus Parcubacteria bacterium]
MKNYKIIKKNKLQRRRELTRAFLLYNFLKLSRREKEKYFNKQVPEVILRTMKLEGEKISRQDIKKLLKSSF